MLSRRTFLITGVGALASPSLLLAQKTGFNEREIVPQLAANDKEDVWTLHFRFQDPRIIVTKVPGRGTKIVWSDTDHVVLVVPTRQIGETDEEILAI